MSINLYTLRSMIPLNLIIFRVSLHRYHTHPHYGLVMYVPFQHYAAEAMCLSLLSDGVSTICDNDKIGTTTCLLSYSQGGIKIIVMTLDGVCMLMC